MRRKFVGWSGALGALAAAVVLSSCGGTGDVAAPRTPQFVLKKVGTSSNAGSMIMGVSRGSIDANNADRVDVFARIVDQNGLPLVGVPIEFEASFVDVRFLGAAPVTEGFPKATQRTDGSGTATITVQAGATPGRLAVTAFAPVNLNLGAVIFFQLADVGFISGMLQLLPSEVQLVDPRAGTTIEFLIIGGSPFRAPEPPYRLQNAETGVGVAEIVDDGAFPVAVRYTVSGKIAGPHSFSVVDGEGHSVTGTVTVEFTEVEIAPEAATLVTGQSQVFAVSGGVAPYICSASGGTLTPSVIEERGGTMTFAAGEVILETSFTILCTDQAGQVAQATVTVAPAPSPSGGVGPTPGPPPEAARLVMQANPPTLNGIEGGTATITANVLDGLFAPLPGIPVLFSLPGQTGDPTPMVPSLSNFTSISDGEGQAVTILTVPSGTAPQFITVNGEADNGTSGSIQIGVTSQRTEPGGPPARISAALLRNDACGQNEDGTFFAVVSALVTDADGNPVEDGIQVDWTGATPVAATSVVTPSFTNGEPPCDTSPYKECLPNGSALSITAQPGTAITCFIYDDERGGDPAAVTATVDGTDIEVTTNFILPSFPPGPTPTPAPPLATPVPTATPGPPVVTPLTANLTVGTSQVFAVTGGLPPYTVAASGGTATPTTVPSSGGVFTYDSTAAGTYSIVISDSNGQVTAATVTNAP